jgi:hypothetical protein
MAQDINANGKGHSFSDELNGIQRRLASVCGFAGVGFGLKETGGKRVSELAWRVYVLRKQPRALLSTTDLVPSFFAGLPTDVVQRELTSVTSFPNSLPLPEGAMIANKKGIPGTLGSWATHEVSGERVLLSNYHVLFGKKCRPGDVIWRVRSNGLQHEFDAIGKNLIGKAAAVCFRQSQFFIDAAIAVANGSDSSVGQANTSCSSQGTAEAEVGSLVSKTGAASQSTFGTIVDICYPDWWHFDLEYSAAPNQLLIQPEVGNDGQKAEVFSRLGDSGAVVRDKAGNVVGLLWGSNARGEGVACHIGPVVNELGIRLEKAVKTELNDEPSTRRRR